MCITRSVVFVTPMQGVGDIAPGGIRTRRSSSRRQPTRRPSLLEFLLEELDSLLQSSATLELHDSSSYLLPTEGHIYHTQSQWSGVLQDQPSAAQALAQVPLVAAYDFFPRFAQTSLIRFWAATTKGVASVGCESNTSGSAAFFALVDRATGFLAAICAS